MNIKEAVAEQAAQSSSSGNTDEKWSQKYSYFLHNIADVSYNYLREVVSAHL